MALHAYLSLLGEAQGHIDGSVTQAGRENLAGAERLAAHRVSASHHAFTTGCY